MEAHDKALAASSDPKKIATLVLGTRRDVTATRAGDKVIVTFKQGDNFTEAMMLRGFHMDAEKLIPRMFNQVKDAQAVEMRANAELSDLRGQTSNELVARLNISRANNERTNWPNILTDNIPRIVDDYWVHPVLKR